MTALAVAGAPTAALASGPDAPVVDHAPEASALTAAPGAEALSAAKDEAPPAPGPGDVAPPDPEAVPAPAPVPSEPEPQPEVPPAEAAAALSTHDTAPLEAPDALPVPEAAEEAPVEVAGPAAADPVEATPAEPGAEAPPADILPVGPPSAGPAEEAPPADAAEALPADAAEAPLPESGDDKEPPPPPSPGAVEGALGDDPAAPVAVAPAEKPEIVVTPARLILRGVDGSTVEVPFSTLPPPVTTTPAPTVIVPLPLPAEPSGDDEEGAEGVDPSELYGPAFPPGFWDDYDGPRLTWMPGAGVVPGLTAPADIPAGGTADPAAAAAATAGAEILDAPNTLPGPAALAPDILPLLSEPPLHGRADAPPEALTAPAPAPPVRAIPVASTTRFTTEVIAAAARTRGDGPDRLGAVASAVRSTTKSVFVATGLKVKAGTDSAVKASTSPWLPFGLLALALLYLLGQRAMDRGSKLSYAGRPGEPDDELIEV